MRICAVQAMDRKERDEVLKEASKFVDPGFKLVAKEKVSRSGVFVFSSLCKQGPRLGVCKHSKPFLDVDFICGGLLCNQNDLRSATEFSPPSSHGAYLHVDLTCPSIPSECKALAIGQQRVRHAVTDKARCKGGSYI